MPPGTTVAEALEVMRRGDFSQLPVKVGRQVVGVFTYRSLANGLGNVRKQDDPLTVTVDDLLEDLRFVRATDEVTTILRYMEEDGAVLVGDEENLLAVATAADVTGFLWGVTRPFVLLQDIELAVRDLMRSACSDEELAGCISAAIPDTAEGVPVRVEDLSLGEILRVVLNGENFGRTFKVTFGRNRGLVQSTLTPVREIRNKVFHFRDDVTAEELDVLVAARRWLLRKTLISRGVA